MFEYQLLRPIDDRTHVLIFEPRKVSSYGNRDPRMFADVTDLAPHECGQIRSRDIGVIAELGVQLGARKAGTLQGRQRFRRN